MNLDGNKKDGFIFILIVLYDSVGEAYSLH